MINYRGTILADNTPLKLEITDSLLDSAMTGGSAVNKIKSMLLQRRKDVNSLQISLKQEKEFFHRNCQIRFWNHEVLVRAYAENKWLTPQLAQVLSIVFPFFLIIKQQIEKQTKNRLEWTNFYRMCTIE